jgi:hypothetical protein
VAVQVACVAQLQQQAAVERLKLLCSYNQQLITQLQLALEAQALLLLLERMVAIQYFQRLLLLAVGAVVDLEV